MPPSRKRRKVRKTYVPHHATGSGKAKRSAASVLAVLVALFGAGIGAFSGSNQLIWIIVGAIAGAVTGYLVGHNMDRGAAKKVK